METRSIVKSLLILLIAVLLLGGARYWQSIKNVDEYVPPTPSASQEPEKLTFKKVYEESPMTSQECWKKVLGKDFETAYTSKDYIINDEVLNEISKCIPQSPSDGIFSEFYDFQAPTTKECLRNALGVRFDAYYKDPKYDPGVETLNKMNQCLE